MRIRKRCPAAQLVAPSPESLHHQQPSGPNDPPIEDVPSPISLPAPPHSDLQLTLAKGTYGWICKTDEDCMQSNTSTQEEALPYDNKTRELPAAARVHAKYSKDNSFGADSASHLEMESTMKTETMEDDSSGMMKKRKKVDKDSAMTDGTRCSRVNGRGWRCWKPTVVGYSGKQQEHTTEACSLVLLDEEPLIMLKKRKKKIGMVKNRSISGLLAQTEPLPAPEIPVHDAIGIL